MDLTYPLLSDPDAAMADALGLRHEGGHPMDGTDIARPARILLDRQGRILWSDISENYRVRPVPQAILEAVKPLITATGEGS